MVAEAAPLAVSDTPARAEVPAELSVEAPIETESTATFTRPPPEVVPTAPPLAEATTANFVRTARLDASPATAAWAQLGIAEPSPAEAVRVLGALVSVLLRDPAMVEALREALGQAPRKQD